MDCFRNQVKKKFPELFVQTRAGSWGQDTVQAGVQLGFASYFYLEKVLIFPVSRGLLYEPLKEVMIFGVSQGVPTDPFGKVMIFGVSGGMPTDLGD